MRNAAALAACSTHKACLRGTFRPRIAIRMKSFLPFLLGCGVALSSSLGAETAAGSFKGSAGLQLYSLREQFKQDVPGTLDRVKALGFTLVETAGTYGNTPEKFTQMLKERGLTAVSAHYQYEALTKDIAAIVREAGALGVKFVVCPWIPHQNDTFNEADARHAAADFNRWGEAFKAAGIQFGYHCHGYEFRPVQEGAKETAFDVLVRETKPELVTFEMDVFWVMADNGKLPAEETECVLEALATPLVDYLLFADEVPLPSGGILGDPLFKAAFLTNKRLSQDGHSLKDLNLAHRLFQNRCSYMSCDITRPKWSPMSTC